PAERGRELLELGREMVGELAHALREPGRIRRRLLARRRGLLQHPRVLRVHLLVQVRELGDLDHELARGRDVLGQAVERLLRLLAARVERGLRVPAGRPPPPRERAPPRAPRRHAPGPPPPLPPPPRAEAPPR